MRVADTSADSRTRLLVCGRMLWAVLASVQILPLAGVGGAGREKALGTRELFARVAPVASGAVAALCLATEPIVHTDSPWRAHLRSRGRLVTEVACDAGSIARRRVELWLIAHGTGSTRTLRPIDTPVAKGASNCLPRLAIEARATDAIGGPCGRVVGVQQRVQRSVCVGLRMNCTYRQRLCTAARAVER